MDQLAAAVHRDLPFLTSLKSLKLVKAIVNVAINHLKTLRFQATRTGRQRLILGMNNQSSPKTQTDQSQKT